MKNIKCIIKNKKIIILIPLIILFAILLINSGNIYNLLKGNTWTIENVKLNEGELIAQIHDDNGYVLFDENNKAYLSLNKDTKNANVYDVKVRLKFTVNSAIKKAVITLNEGINLISDGSEGLGKDKLKTISKTLPEGSIKNVYYTTRVGSAVGTTTYKTYNYITTYTFNETLSEVTLTLQVSPDNALDYSNIEDAITIELLQNDEIKCTKSIDIEQDFSTIGITIDGGMYSSYAVATNGQDAYKDVKNYNIYDNLLGLYSYNTTSRQILYEYIYFTVKAPKLATLVGTEVRKSYVGNGGFPYIGYSDDKSADEISSVEELDCSLVKEDSVYYKYCVNNYNYASDYVKDYYLEKSAIFNDSYNYDYDKNYDGSYNKENYKLYIFKVKNVYAYMYGVVPSWKFDKNSVSVGGTVHVEGVNVTYKTYGGKEQSVDYNSINKTDNKVENLSSNNFNITEKAVINAKAISYTVKSYNKEQKEQDVPLGYYTFENVSPITINNAKITINFDSNIGISSINLPDMDEILKVTVITNKNNFEKEVTLNKSHSISSANDSAYERYLLNKEDIGLDNDEYITSISYVWNIPAYYRQNGDWLNSYSGIIFDSSKLIANNNKIITNIKVSIPDDKDYTFTSTGTIDLENKNIKAYPIFYNISTSTILKTGERKSFKVEIRETNSNGAIFQRILYNPIIYIRSETGLDITNINLVNSDGVNLCDKINCNNEPYINNKNEKIYKIDTSSITDGSAKVGYLGHRESNILKTLTLTYDIDVPVGFSDSEKKHSFQDMVYVTSKEANSIYEYYSYIGYYRDKNESLFKELNTEDDEIVMTSRNTYAYYKIVSDVDFISNLYQKNKNDEFVTWNSEKDDLSIDMDNNFELKLEVLNNTGYDFPYNNSSNEVATIYIPIPKKDDNWYNLSNNSAFKFSLKLNSITSKLEKGNGTYSISYAYVDTKKMNANGTLNLDELYKTSNWSDTLESNHNIIKIELNNLKKDSLISFNIKYKLADNKEVYNTSKRLQFKYIMYKNVSTKNGKLSINKIGNDVGITNELSKYELLVIHKDIYDTILDTEKSILNYGTSYETSKKEFENYEIFLEPPNELYPEEKEGIITKDTTVTYVYKSTELRNVIVHYIDEDSNDKLFDDIELKGKDLEKFETEYKSIDGYNLTKIIKDNETIKPDDNIVKGAYKKDIQEITYYYKKIPVVSTLDNIIIYISLFVLSLSGIITFIIYKKKSRNSN